MRAVLDVNVLISALISPRGAPAQIVAEWESGLFELIASEELIAELRRAGGYPKLRDVLDHADLEDLAEAIRGAASIGDAPAPISLRSVDPADDYLLALAAAHGAALVTGDRHLLALTDRAPIYAPRDFLEQLGV